MMTHMTHNLKLKAEYVNDVMLEIKTFELRKNDRDYKVGDAIHFIQVDGSEFEPLFYDDTSKNLFKITYILENVPEYGLDKDYCILGIERVY